MIKIAIGLTKGTTTSTRTFDNIDRDIEDVPDENVTPFATAYKDLLDGYTAKSLKVTQYETHEVEWA